MKPSRPLALLGLALALGLLALLLRSDGARGRSDEGLSLGAREMDGSTSVATTDLKAAEEVPDVEVEAIEAVASESPTSPNRTDAASAHPWVDPQTHVLVEGKVVESLVIGRSKPLRPGANLPITLEVGHTHGSTRGSFRFSNSDESEDDEIEERRSRTDELGHFRFVVPWPADQEFHLTMVVPGDSTYRELRRQISLVGSRATTEVTLTRVLDGRANGVVVDEEGEPLVGLEMSWALQPSWEARYHRIEPKGSMITAADGSWQIEEPLFEAPKLIGVAGYEVIDDRSTKPQRKGGWRTGRRVLRRTGSLVVEVSDTLGKNVEGVEVSACVASKGGKLVSGRTGSGGRVELRGLPTQDQLQVTVESGRTRVSGLRQLAGQLLPPDSEAGEPLRIDEGWLSPLEVTLDSVAPLRVYCKGLTTESAQVEVLYQQDGHWKQLRGTASAEAPAIFELPASLSGEALWIRAWVPPVNWGKTRRETSLTDGSFAAPPELPRPVADLVARNAQQRVSLSPGGPPPEVSLTLTSALEMTGSLRGRHALRARVRAVPLSPFAQIPSDAEQSHYAANQDGHREFQISGLSAGEYALEVSSKQGGLGGSVVRGPTVPAGTSNIQINLDANLPVEIELVPAEDGQALKSVLVEVFRLDATLAAKPPTTLASAFVALRDLSQVELLGNWAQTFDKPGASIELPATQAGIYLVRVSPVAASGERLAKVVSAPMRLRAGRHVLRYALLKTGNLSIRFPRDGLLAHEAQLVDESGRAFPRRLRNNPSSTIFNRKKVPFLRIKYIPPGSYTVRIGPKGSLANGDWERELPVEVRAGETTTINLDK